MYMHLSFIVSNDQYITWKKMGHSAWALTNQVDAYSEGSTAG